MSLTPAASSAGDREFDEENVERYQGDRAVLGGMDPSAKPIQSASTPAPPPAPSPPADGQK